MIQSIPQQVYQVYLGELDPNEVFAAKAVGHKNVLDYVSVHRTELQRLGNSDAPGIHEDAPYWRSAMKWDNRSYAWVPTIILGKTPDTLQADASYTVLALGGLPAGVEEVRGKNLLLAAHSDAKKMVLVVYLAMRLARYCVGTNEGDPALAQAALEVLCADPWVDTTIRSLIHMNNGFEDIMRKRISPADFGYRTPFGEHRAGYAWMEPSVQKYYEKGMTR